MRLKLEYLPRDWLVGFHYHREPFPDWPGWWHLYVHLLPCVALRVSWLAKYRPDVRNECAEEKQLEVQDGAKD